MRIVYLASGAGDMYCGSCLHGNTLASAVRAAGEDALLVPMYTPLKTDDQSLESPRLAFNGISVYLQQKSALFRHTPWLLDRLLDRPALLRWLGRRSASTRPEDLGELTVSMLRGEQGRQRKELDKLLAWLAGDVRPEVVHLSNALLAGVARQIGQRLGVPVVATLSGEDLFLECLPEPHRTLARETLRQRAADLTAMVALNRYYADFMAQYLSVDRAKIHVIPPGLNLSSHGADEDHGEQDSAGPCARTPGVKTIGFLGRIVPEKGLHLLVKVLEQLAADPRLPPLAVVAAGYLSPADRPYLTLLEAHLAACGLGERFRYLGEVSLAGKVAFLRSLDVICLPSLCPESKGMPLLEAWAQGIPAVVPEHGAFAEMVAETGGGLLFQPCDAPSLAVRLTELLLDPEQAAACGRRARQAIRQRYHAPLMAQRTIELYRRLLTPQ